MRNAGIVRVLAISGSLRRTSSNSALVAAAVRVAPSGVDVSVFGELADVPPFNPDLDTETAPAGVARFRTALEACDAILICSPEYAHGVSGVLKNALDWVVSSGELIDKPIALINASGRATLAYAALRETLVTMSGRVVEDASVTIPLEGSKCDATGIAQDVTLAGLLRASLAALARVARAGTGRE
jgi:NAD(P)H-dependent FMN reductase